MSTIGEAKETLTQVCNSAIHFNDSVLEEIIENPELWTWQELTQKAEEYISEGEYQTAILLLALAESEGDW